MSFKLSEYAIQHPYEPQKFEPESLSKSPVIIDKLTKIGQIQDKNVMWICSDLSTTESSPITRFIWTFFVKYFVWLRERFFGVNLDRSKEFLSRIGSLTDKQDVRLVNLYNLAVQKFNSIAPRHAAPELKYTFEDIKKDNFALVGQIDPQDYQSLYEEAVKESAGKGMAFLQEAIQQFNPLNPCAVSFLRTVLLAQTPEQFRDLRPYLHKLTFQNFFTLAPLNELKIEQLRVYTEVGFNNKSTLNKLIWASEVSVNDQGSQPTTSTDPGEPISFTDNFIRN
ncbi:MAG: hypothetical protein ACHQUC_07570, partial [Chlamydiales bacterium]